MGKHVYISADYDIDSGDRDVVDELNKWSEDSHRKVEFTDMAEVASGSVSKDPDCRICDLKREFNAQIAASSAVIFVIGDKTARRTAGSECKRNFIEQAGCYCTPYKQNANGIRQCRIRYTCSAAESEDFGNINGYSYLRHEFEQAQRRGKHIVVVYNSMRRESGWLPSYLKDYESLAQPFWVKDSLGRRVGNYSFIKGELGF